jgi:hypothetical protein
MKMTLIEDRPFRLDQFQTNYGINLFAKYDFLEFFPIDQLELLKKDLQQNQLERVNDYSLIMAHKSAFSITEASNLDKTAATLIYFSGGISKSYLTNTTKLTVFINSKDFYNDNLIKFLDLVLTEKIIEPSCLLFGDKWKLNLIIEFLEKITIKFNNFIHQDIDYLIPEEFNELVKDRAIVEFKNNNFVDELKKLTENGLDKSEKHILENIINQIKSILENKILFEA